MDKYVGLLFLILFMQLITFTWVWGMARELRLIGSVVERIKVWTSKR